MNWAVVVGQRGGNGCPSCQDFVSDRKWDLQPRETQVSNEPLVSGLSTVATGGTTDADKGTKSSRFPGKDAFIFGRADFDRLCGPQWGGSG